MIVSNPVTVVTIQPCNYVTMVIVPNPCCVFLYVVQCVAVPVVARYLLLYPHLHPCGGPVGVSCSRRPTPCHYGELVTGC